MGHELKTFPLVALVEFLAIVPLTTSAAEIYTCTDENGNIAYQQLPCPAEKAEPVEPEAPAGLVDDVIDVIDEPDEALPSAPSSRRPDEPLDDCKKRYRDQIDEIDAELSNALSTEQNEAYKKQLLALAQQLRACG
jgi:hypothetical protein